MPVIMHPVGRGGYNRREDVICIQTALANAKVSGLGPFWQGKIDGKMSPDLMDAITLLQHAVHAPANGRVGKNCPTCMSLERVLPAAFKGMVAEKNGGGSQGPKPATRDGRPGPAPRRRPKAPLLRDQTLKKMVLPMGLRNDLTAFRGAVDRELDTLVSYRPLRTDPSGYLHFEFDVDPMPGTDDVREILRMTHNIRGIRALPGGRLILTSTQPIRFRPGTLRPGAAGHHMLTGKVSQNSGPVHDAAAIQAALANIKRPGVSAAFWTAAIDGKPSPVLHKAFNEFQIAADIAPTGGLGRGEETEKALIAALPQELKRLKGVEGLPVAFVSGAGNPPTVPLSRLPEAMRDAVQPVAKAVEDRLGLPLVLREPPRSLAGRIDVRIGVGNGIYLDSQGRPMPHDKTPDVITAAVAKVLETDSNLDLDPNAGPGRLVLSMLGDAESHRDVEITYEEEQAFHIDVTHLVLEARGYLEEIGVTPDMIALAVDDVRMATKVAGELGFTGQAYAKTINGRVQIVIKGYAGNRATLTATHYPPGHAKVIAFGVGQLGRAASALKSVAYVGFAVLAADEIFLAMAGEQGYDEAVAGFGIGVAKILTATVIAEITGLIAAGATGGLILVPLIVAATAAFAASWALNELDQKYGMTEALKEYVREQRNTNWSVNKNPAPAGLPAKAYRPESYLE